MTQARPLTVLATMRNEGAFLLDWVAHQKALGFDRLVICTNDCDDPTAEMVQRLEALGLARHSPTQPGPGRTLQRVAYAQAWGLPAVQQAQWLWICDADEYLTVHLGDGSLRALVAAAGEGAEAILVPWRIFGPAGRWDHADRPAAALSGAAEVPRRRLAWVKPLVRGGTPLRMPPIHVPHASVSLGRPLRLERPGGGPAQIRPPHFQRVPADWSAAQVNHYALRSGEAFLVKRDRGGPAPQAAGTDLGYWDTYDRRRTVPCHAIRRYEPAAAPWRARLRADPVLGPLHAAAVDWLRARAAALAADPARAGLVAALRARPAAHAVAAGGGA